MIYLFTEINSYLITKYFYHNGEFYWHMFDSYREENTYAKILLFNNTLKIPVFDYIIDMEKTLHRISNPISLKNGDLYTYLEYYLEQKILERLL